jgi:uncharacterized membrane protein YtjA (UPF0391 family)
MVFTGTVGISPNWAQPFFEGDLTMLRLAIVFLVIALVAAFVGYGGVASYSWEGAKILFVIFLVLAVLSYLGHGYRRGSFFGAD